MVDKSIWTRAGEALGIVEADPGPDSQIAKAAPTQTLGTSVISMNDYGLLETAPDRELNLIGQMRFDTYDRMVRDVAIVSAGVRLFLNLIANAIWTVNPPENLNDADTATAQDYADQAYEMLFSMTSSWSTVVRKTAAFRLVGFAVMEWTAVRLPDGRIGFLDVEHRPQRTIVRWQRDQSGTVEAVVQRVTGRADVPLPRSKIVYAVDDTLTDSPEGLGLFRHLAATAERLKTFLELEETGFTTDLRGIPIARAPLKELRTEVEESGPRGSEAHARAEGRRTQLLNPLREFIRKHVRNKQSGVLLASDTFEGRTTDGAATPSSVPKWALELLNGDSTAFDAMANAINRMNQEMARILGTEHMLLGAEGGGSLALGRSKVGTFYQTVTSTLLDLVEVFDRDLLMPLAELNAWPEELRPQMGVNEISDRDIEQVLAALKDLSIAGAPMMSGDPAEGEIYDLLGLTRPPERTPDDDLSLNPGRKDKLNPDDELEKNPEDGIAKSQMLRSRRRRPTRRSAP